MAPVSRVAGSLKMYNWKMRERWSSWYLNFVKLKLNIKHYLATWQRYTQTSSYMFSSITRIFICLVGLIINPTVNPWNLIMMQNGRELMQLILVYEPCLYTNSWISVFECADRCSINPLFEVLASAQGHSDGASFSLLFRSSKVHFLPHRVE